MNVLQPTPFLLSLRAAFQKAGFDIRDVGGSVRDALKGIAPKDRDFCTDADPDQQIAIYKNSNYRHIETGLKHGTLTVVDPDTGDTFEITSLRLESDHDGRHATVTYTSDWTADLARRDLTINAMAMDFSGVLYDPFGGKDDLEKNRVRFVGDPVLRIREDYLRILRYFRFLGRFGDQVDGGAFDAIKANRDGLKQISVERIWSEMARIIVGPQAEMVLSLMRETGVSEIIGLGCSARSVISTNPITQLVWMEGNNAAKLTFDWKMSVAEQQLAAYLLSLEGERVDYKYQMAVKGVSRQWVKELACLNGDLYLLGDIDEWPIPVFPLSGTDLLDHGIKPGPTMGHILKSAKAYWAQSGYAADTEELLNVFVRSGGLD